MSDLMRMPISYEVSGCPARLDPEIMAALPRAILAPRGALSADFGAMLRALSGYVESVERCLGVEIEALIGEGGAAAGEAPAVREGERAER